MAGLKTVKTARSVAAFIKAIKDPIRRSEAKSLNSLMTRVTCKKAALWGISIIGYGTYHYKYASGREGDWPLTGFAIRKQNISIYIMPGFEHYKSELKKIGKHKHSVSCLYVSHLKDIDLLVLESIIKDSIRRMQKKYRM